MLIGLALEKLGFLGLAPEKLGFLVMIATDPLNVLVLSAMSLHSCAVVKIRNHRYVLVSRRNQAEQVFIAGERHALWDVFSIST